MKSSTIVLYQAYGSTSIYYQVAFSILTLYYHLQGNFAETKVVVYTDNKSFFKCFEGVIPIHLELLQPSDLITYKGTYNFIHRVKVCVIQACLTKYQSNVLYLDSDTYFKKSPQLLFHQIDKEHSIMNSDDYDLNEAAPLYENIDWLKIRQAIKNFEYSVEGKVTKISLKTRMWNAGVIGISYMNVHLVKLVLNLTDQIYKNVKVFTAEQFAFSYYLQNETLLASSGDTIFHYWQNHTGQFWKDAYSKEFERFFKQNKSKSISELASLAFERTMQHNAIVEKYKPSFIKKIIKRFKLIVQVAKKGKL